VLVSLSTLVGMLETSAQDPSAPTSGSRVGGRREAIFYFCFFVEAKPKFIGLKSRATPFLTGIRLAISPIKQSDPIGLKCSACLFLG